MGEEMQNYSSRCIYIVDIFRYNPRLHKDKDCNRSQLSAFGCVLRRLGLAKYQGYRVME